MSVDHRCKGAGFALSLLAAVIAVVMPGTAASAATRAGTAIDNVAAVSFDIDGVPATGRSNPDRFTVAERLDLTLAVQPTPVSDDGSVAAVLLVNDGNGDEAFVIGAASNAGTVRSVAVDTDGDGRADDTLVDGRTPSLAPGASLQILVFLDRAGTPPAAASVEITARAVTGSGAPGLVFEGSGDGGGAAVVGTTGAAAAVSVALPVPDPVPPTLAKSQEVVAPDGSPRPVRGAVVTYTLVANFTGAVSDARIDDPIPPGTAFVPGSITLDDVTLSDAADIDPGGFDGRTVSVALGNAPRTRATVRFQVRIP